MSAAEESTVRIGQEGTVRLADMPTQIAGDPVDVTEPMTMTFGGEAPSSPGGAGSPPPAGRFRYELLSFLARGGMGEVHVAKDLDLKRKVAFKKLGAELLAHSGHLSRFVREVQVTAQLDHPNVVPVYGLELAPGGTPAYAMKLVVGRTFKEYIDETRALAGAGATPGGAHALAARLEHFLKVCDAMAYAHGKGVI